MTTACITCTTLSLHRPLWRRLLDRAEDAWVQGRARREQQRRTALQRCLAAFRCWDSRQVAELDDHLLRDIGVPDWLREEAAAHRRADTPWPPSALGRADLSELGARW